MKQYNQAHNRDITKLCPDKNHWNTRCIMREFRNPLKCKTEKKEKKKRDYKRRILDSIEI